GIVRVIIIIRCHRSIVALGPSQMLKTYGSPGDEPGRNQQYQESDSKKACLRHVSLGRNRVINDSAATIRFWLDSQIIVPRWHRGGPHRGLLLPPGPKPVFIMAVVVAQLPAEIESPTRVLIDECTVQ